MPPDTSRKVATDYADEVRAYLGGPEEAARTGTFFAFLGGVVAVGKKATA